MATMAIFAAMLGLYLLTRTNFVCLGGRIAKSTVAWALLCILAAPLCGCQQAIPPAGYTGLQAQSPTIAKDDPIKTVLQYRAAVEVAMKQAEADCGDKIGAERLVLFAREFAKSKSAVGRNYARALAQTLKRDHVNGAPDLSIPDGGDAAISYAELARIDGWTISMIGYPQAKISPEGQVIPLNIKPQLLIPYETWVHVLWTIGASCPCDAAAFNAAIAMNNPLPVDITQEEPPNYLLRKWMGVNYRAVFPRMTNPRRALNLSSCLVLGGTLDPEIILYYAMSVEKPTGHDVQDMVKGLQAATKRARKLDPPQASEKELNSLEPDNDAEWEFIRVMDWSLLATKNAAPALRQFVDAVNRKDLAAAQKHLDPSTKIDITALREAIGGPGARSIALRDVCITAVEHRGELELFLDVQRADGSKAVESITVDVKEAGSGWLIERVSTASR